jgi:DNA-binding transcriptional LysR family regulator
LTWALQVVATVLEQHLIVEFASDHRLRKELQIKPAAVDAEILVDLEIPGLRGRAYHPTFNRAFWRHIDFSVHAINTGPLLEMMRPDFGLSIQPPPDGAFHYEHLLEDEFVLLCPSGQPLSRHKTCRWVDFKDYPLISRSGTTSIQMLAASVFQELNVTVPHAHECSNLYLSGKLVAAGLGIAALPRLALSQLERKINDNERGFS